MSCRHVLLIALLALFSGSGAMALDLRNVTFTTNGGGVVVFSHKAHISQKAMANNCKACHDGIFNIRHKVRFTMADMENGKSCGACHNGKEAFPLKECVRCHQVKEITIQVKSTGPTHFSHKSHVAASPDCGTCHPKLFAAGPNTRQTMADMKNGKSCGACHDGKKAFSIDACVKCHPVREIVYQVKQTGPTRFSHTTHIEAHQCSDCHTRLYPVKRQTRHITMAQMEKGSSCGACHNGKGAFPLKNCTTCHPAKELVFVDKDAGNVTFSHKAHLGMYGCSDCHTKLYAPARSSKKVSMKEMEGGKSCGACHDSKTAFSVTDKCDTCHKM